MNNPTHAPGTIPMSKNTGHRLALLTLIGILVFGSPRSQAQELIVPPEMTNTGYYGVLSYTQNDFARYSQNYTINEVGWDGTVGHRPFIFFNLSHYSGSISSVVIKVSTANWSSDDPSETVQFYDVAMNSYAILEAPYGLQPLPGAYADLGSGNILGSATFSASTTNPFPVSLDVGGWATQLQAVRGSVVIGGNVTSLRNVNADPEYFRINLDEVRVTGELTYINTMVPAFYRSADGAFLAKVQFVQGTATGTRPIAAGSYASYYIYDVADNYREIASSNGLVDANGFLPVKSFSYEGAAQTLQVVGQHSDGVLVNADPIDLPLTPNLPLFDCCNHAMSPAGEKARISKDPIRYGTGDIVMYVEDLVSGGFDPWSLRRSYSNVMPPAAGSPLGDGWHVDAMPIINYFNSGTGTETIEVRLGSAQGLGYRIDRSTTPVQYIPLRPHLEKVMESANDLVLIDTTGRRIVFHGIGAAVNPALRGKLKQTIEASGSVTGYGHDAATGLMTQMLRVGSLDGVPVQEAIDFTYNQGRLASAVRSVTRNGVSQVARKAIYQYYAGGPGDFGEPGQLALVQIQNAANVTLTRYHYRYWRSGQLQTLTNTQAIPGLLRFVIATGAYERMSQTVDPLTATDVQMMAYADKYWEYDQQRRVVRQVLRGNEIDGTGMQRFAYASRGWDYNVSNPYNMWRTKTTETLDDGTINIVYCNESSQVLVSLVLEAQATNRTWIDAFQYDTAGREVWHGTPSVFTGYDPSAFEASGTLGLSTTATFLKPSDGLILRRQYYSTSAAPGVVGGAAGRLQYEMSQMGKNGTPARTRELKYIGVQGN